MSQLSVGDTLTHQANRKSPMSSAHDKTDIGRASQEKQAALIKPKKSSITGPEKMPNGKKKQREEEKEAETRAKTRKQDEQARQLAVSLRAAANEGKVELVRLLLKCGADVNAQDAEFGNTALHQAAWNGFSETVQVLCKHRASTSIRNKALANTPLHLACQQGHNQSARLLVMAGARGELKNSVGDTPLHTAARYGHAGAARILLSAKCNPNLVNTNNDTPLHIAAAMGKRKLTKILMQNGAEPMIKNKQCDTAMDIALRRDLIEIQELIANPPPKSAKSHYHHHRNHHHHHHHHNHHRGHRGGERDPANNHDNYHGHRQQHHSHHHSQQHLLRSTTNLIVLDDKTQLPPSELHKRQLSISSNQQPQQSQANHQLLCSQLYSSSSGRLFGLTGAHHPKLARANQLPLQRHISTSSKRMMQGHCDEASSSISNRTPVDAVDRSRTLAGGLGVSSAALDELMRARRATPPTQCEKPRPSSAGSVGRPLTSIGEGLAKRRVLKRQRQQAHAAEIDGELIKAHKSTTSRLSRSSPTASVRSSQVSRMRGRRLVVGPRRLTLAIGSGDKSEHGLPGTSKRRSISASHIAAGRSSLLQLRLMVRRRQAMLKLKQDQQDSANIHSSQIKLETPDEQQEDARAWPTGGSSHSETPEGENERPVSQNQTQVAVSGRREERARQSQEDTARCQMRAPNGTKLLKTRPLAPLNDDTQLYAIPRKSAKAKQQVANDNERRANEAGGSQQEDAQERPSGNVEEAETTTSTTTGEGNKLRGQQRTSATPNGAALTASDSGHSLASGSSVADLQASASPPARHSLQRHDEDAISCSSSGSKSEDQMASSSDECIKSLNCPAPVRQLSAKRAKNRPESMSEEDDRDFGAPGYSVVVRGRPRERRAELSASTAEPPCHCSPQAIEAPATSKLHHLLALEPQTVSGAGQQGEGAAKLIEPKSVLGGANAELIAAQKSLAAAAAAKVHRDRLAKMSRGPETLLRIGGEQQLSVKTDWLQHHQQHQTLVAAAASRVRHDEQRAQRIINGHNAADCAAGAEPNIMGGHQKHATSSAVPVNGSGGGGGGGAHRSGTNSVGMSDSSPSNNGAATDSDNSIQTTSGVGGSLNTDNTSQLTDGGGQQQTTLSSCLVAQPTKSSKQQQVGKSSGPFGILSRILLNGGNSKAKSAQQTHGPAKVDGEKSRTSSGADEAAHVKTTFSGSLSSSSALSSPSISTNGQSPNSTADSTATNGDHQAAESTRTHLDQLGSRSRRPIVLSQSNELSSSSEGGGEIDHPDSQVAQSLPTKGVLKMPSSGAGGGAQYKYEIEQRENLHEIYGSNMASFMDEPNALVNGLPRVSSYTQISAHHQRAQQDPNNLCNYHALNRSHMIQAKYSPYLPYALGRYSIHETCDPSSAARPGYGPAPPLQNNARYLNHYQQANVAAYGTTTAYNNNNNGTSQDDSLANASMLCHYSHDDSIYIPPFSHPNRNDYHNSQMHSAGAAGGPSYPAAYRSTSNRNHHEASFIDYHHQSRAVIPSRPKSSLDTLVGGGGGVGGEQQQLYGQRLSATRINDTAAAAASIIRYGGQSAARSQSQLADPVAGHHHPANQHQQQPSSHLITMTTNQNSVYASHHLAGYSSGGAHHQHQKSELTVLPATGFPPRDGPATSTTTIPISTKETPAGGFKSLVQVNKQPAETVIGHSRNGGHRRNRHIETTPANNETSATTKTMASRADQSSSPPPPTLPPKTMTTIGKLTKVSIKPRDSSQWQSTTTTGHRERATQFNVDVDRDDDQDEYMGATVL